MQANASKYKQMQAKTNKYKRIQTNKKLQAIRYNKVHAHTMKCTQTQATQTNTSAFIVTEKIRYICMNKNRKNHFIVIASIFHSMMDQQMCTEALHAVHPLPLEKHHT